MRKLTEAERRVVCTWSGGIDSTSVLAQLLKRGHDVLAVTLDIYGGAFSKRERQARDLLVDPLDAVARRHGGNLRMVQRNAAWIWAFSPDHIEIPRRNKHILDRLCTVEAPSYFTKQVAMGEYIGADTWLVKDHVGAADADARSLASYLYQEYGLDWRLFTLADFGESRYKSDRLLIGWEVLGSAMHLTSNCLKESERHCGECYKCIERAAAFFVANLTDATEYAADPEASDTFHLYVRQMQGAPEHASVAEFDMDAMPQAAPS